MHEDACCLAVHTVANVAAVCAVCCCCAAGRHGSAGLPALEGVGIGPSCDVALMQAGLLSAKASLQVLEADAQQSAAARDKIAERVRNLEAATAAAGGATCNAATEAAAEFLGEGGEQAAQEMADAVLGGSNDLVPAAVATLYKFLAV